MHILSHYKAVMSETVQGCHLLCKVLEFNSRIFQAALAKTTAIMIVPVAIMIFSSL